MACLNSEFQRSRMIQIFASLLFALVATLNFVSIGALTWFRVEQTINFGDPKYSREFDTVISSEDYTVHGVVKYKYMVQILRPVPGNQNQTASCASVLQANYWVNGTKWSCQVGGVDDFPAVKNAVDISSQICKAGWCDPSEQDQNQQAYTCSELNAVTSQTFFDQQAKWRVKAICTGGKGVLSLLVISSFSALVALALCYFCSTKMKLMMIPGLFSSLLNIIAVISYGAAISSSYPWQELNFQTQIIAGFVGASSGQSALARVGSGFGVAIASAVISFVGSFWIVYANYYWLKRDFDVELAVVHGATPTAPESTMRDVQETVSTPADEAIPGQREQCNEETEGGTARNPENDVAGRV
mmetsp:Transcript_31381/g.70609  ORF Transcript_31381/g.70609 Transcript_31381/m.70609 type:complete len:358 (-) Transcript_31381:518-1591(-)